MQATSLLLMCERKITLFLQNRFLQKKVFCLTSSPIFIASEVLDRSKNSAHVHAAAVCVLGYCLIADLESKKRIIILRNYSTSLRGKLLQLIYIDVS